LKRCAGTFSEDFAINTLTVLNCSALPASWLNGTTGARARLHEVPLVLVNADNLVALVHRL
jgi:hypothetical protein